MKLKKLLKMVYPAEDIRISDNGATIYEGDILDVPYRILIDYGDRYVSNFYDENGALCFSLKGRVVNG